MMNGIDVSHWQGAIDFNKVKQAGYQFVIIKAGGSDNGFYTDRCFEKYYNDAVAAGLYVGAYYFVGSKFQGTESGKADAQRFMNIIKGKKFTMPVYVDIEVTPNSKKAETTDRAIAFCKELEYNNYYVGIYGSDYSTFVAKVQDYRLKSWTHWVARYGSIPKYTKPYAIWQNGSTTKVQGVSSARCDTNFCYQNFPATIEKLHLNNC